MASMKIEQEVCPNCGDVVVFDPVEIDPTDSPFILYCPKGCMPFVVGTGQTDEKKQDVGAYMYFADGRPARDHNEFMNAFHDAQRRLGAAAGVIVRLSPIIPLDQPKVHHPDEPMIWPSFSDGGGI